MPELPLRILTLAFSDEVAVGLVGDEELVLLELAVGSADDHAVLDGEKGLVVGRHPAVEILAVEERLEAVVRRPQGRGEGGEEEQGEPEGSGECHGGATPGCGKEEGRADSAEDNGPGQSSCLAIRREGR